MNDHAEDDEKPERLVEHVPQRCLVVFVGRPRENREHGAHEQGREEERLLDGYAST